MKTFDNPAFQEKIAAIKPTPSERTIFAPICVNIDTGEWIIVVRTDSFILNGTSLQPFSQLTLYIDSEKTVKSDPEKMKPFKRTEEAASVYSLVRLGFQLSLM